MQKIKNAHNTFTSSNSRSKLDRAFNPVYSTKDEEFETPVMTKLKADRAAKNENSLYERHAEAEHFERSLRVSESEFQSPEDEFHWMSFASYNFLKIAPNLTFKTTNNEK